MDEVDSRAAEAARNAMIEIALNEYDDENSLLDMNELSSKYNISATSLFR